MGSQWHSARKGDLLSWSLPFMILFGAVGQGDEENQMHQGRPRVVKNSPRLLGHQIALFLDHML